MSSLVGGRQNELGSHLDVCSTLHVYFEVLGPSHGFGVRNSSSAVVMTTHERPPQARRLRARRAHGALWTMAQGRHNKLPPNQPLPRTPCISPSALDAHGVTVIHALGACRVMTRRAPRSARGAGVPRLAGEVASVFALSSGRAAARTHAIDGVAPRAAHAHHLDGRAVAQRVGSARHDARSRAATRRRALRPRAPPPHRAAAAHAARRRGERHRARPWSAFRVLRLHARARSHTRAHSKGVRQSSPLRGWLLGVPPQRAAGRPSASTRSAQYTPSLLLRCRARVASLRRAAREGGALWHALADTAGAGGRLLYRHLLYGNTPICSWPPGATNGALPCSALPIVRPRARALAVVAADGAQRRLLASRSTPQAHKTIFIFPPRNHSTSSTQRASASRSGGASDSSPHHAVDPVDLAWHHSLRSARRLRLDGAFLQSVSWLALLQ